MSQNRSSRDQGREVIKAGTLERRLNWRVSKRMFPGVAQCLPTDHSAGLPQCLCREAFVRHLLYVEADNESSSGAYAWARHHTRCCKDYLRTKLYELIGFEHFAHRQGAPYKMATYMHKQQYACMPCILHTHQSSTKRGFFREPFMRSVSRFFLFMV